MLERDMWSDWYCLVLSGKFLVRMFGMRMFGMRMFGMRMSGVRMFGVRMPVVVEGA